MCAKSLEAAKHIEKLIATIPESASTVPLKSKLPVASRFRRDANRVARYAIRVARESSKRKMSGIN